MSSLGHNERSFRLDALAAEARDGLDRVEKGEEFTIGGWLAYGHALNEGRALFPGDREFGQWIEANVHSQLAKAPSHDDRLAAMWAAANADQFEEARQRGNPRTIRGIHAKWKEIEAERAEEQRRKEAEERAKADAEAAKAAEEHHESTDASGPVHKPSGGPEADKAGISVADVAADGPAPTHEEPGQDETEAETPLPPDPYGYAKLTDEALLDLANGLRADLDEEKAARKAAVAEAKALKAQIAELTAADDAGRKIGNLLRRLERSEGRSKEHQANAARLQKQVNAQKAEIKSLRQQIEGQEIPLC